MPDKLVTFDPIDAPLREAYQYYQSLPDDVRADTYTHAFWLDPMNWQRHAPPDWIFSLEWRSFRYAELDDAAKLRATVSERRAGVYIFSVAPGQLVAGFPQFALYVGISNEKNSNRPLRERLSDYSPKRISQIKKRKSVHKLLRLYFEHVWVHFAYVDRASDELTSAEKELHGYLAPPAAQREYPVDMKPYRRAF
jgi:hypothetical protein